MTFEIFIKILQKKWNCSKSPLYTKRHTSGGLNLIQMANFRKFWQFYEKTFRGRLNELDFFSQARILKKSHRWSGEKKIIRSYLKKKFIGLLYFCKYIYFGLQSIIAWIKKYKGSLHGLLINSKKIEKRERILKELTKFDVFTKTFRTAVLR